MVDDEPDLDDGHQDQGTNPEGDVIAPAGAVTGLVDLAAKRLGGMILSASDEFFGAKENLLEPLPPTYDVTAYADRGKVMDGWETRRRRGPGQDWVVIRLGVTGVVEAVVVDTSFFRGNFPQAFELWGTVSPDGPPTGTSEWTHLLSHTTLRGDQVQRFEIDHPQRVTHVKFVIHPDGGVARLRVLGRPLVDVRDVADPGGRLDLAALVNGGRAVACSDAFFSPPSNLIMVGDAQDMSDGWETKRRRGPGHDWAIIELATTAILERIEIDTTHFKGNYPDTCSVLVLDAPGVPVEKLPEEGWSVLAAERPMQPHHRHVLDVTEGIPATHLKLLVVPDGGIARLRAFGQVTEEGWRRATVRLLDTGTTSWARHALLACCGSSAWAEQMVDARPFGEPEDLLRAAEEIWWRLGPDDHLEAFEAHPRIGERSASRWSSREQSQAQSGEQTTKDRIAAGNLAYEERFGHIFLIRAAGRSAEEILAALEERLDNDAETERRIAAEQQAQITALRLDALLREGTTG
ncbi:allantoicase [Euzebya tangerina]|uniref:allantoicase n=1 Tax=Euzebya tangerina TaxID=591198 RepID=UPI000E30CABB|nr:allantoicase [Euzebya tangerina]